MTVSQSSPRSVDHAAVSTWPQRNPASEPRGVDVWSNDSLDVCQGCVVIPVLGGTIPVLARCLQGEIRKVSKHGMQIHLRSGKGLHEGDQVAVGAMMPNEETRFTSLIVTKVGGDETGEVVVEGGYGGPLLAFVSGGLYSPRLNANLEFEFPVKEATLRRLADAGILNRVLIDRVHVCPRCGGLPTYRWGCECCRSVRTTVDEMIHHYACAYVGPVAQFRDGEVLRCPKCLAARLIVGSDFEYLKGKHRCQDCGWSGSELAHVARCLRCAEEFTPQQAAVRDVVGYRACRLDASDLTRRPDE